MRESDARKDGGTYGEHTTQYDEDRYGDEPEGKREDQDTPCDKTIITASDNCVCGLPKSQHQAQAAPAHAHAPKWEETAAIAGRLTFGQTREVLADTVAERDQTRAACDALADALRAWERARADGGISHADLYEAAWRKTQSALAQWKEARHE